MHVVYACEPTPESLTSSIFLAGPTPREASTPSWRTAALAYLEQHGYQGTVFVPEPRDHKWREDYQEQVDWEDAHLNIADKIVFWVPRDLTTLPGFTTNDEWGYWKTSSKVVWGSPPDAPKTRYQRHYAKKLNIPRCSTLEKCLQTCIDELGEGQLRTAGERWVPLVIWNTPMFQSWYQILQQAGNRLDSAQVLFIHRVGPSRAYLFLWAMKVNVYIPSENRNKSGEIVVARPDIACIVAYQKIGTSPLDYRVLLVREFRSPVRNTSGFVWELPGGSSFANNEDMRTVAQSELEEECGIKVDAQQLVEHGSRQLVSTLSSHHAHVFSVELSEQNVAYLESQKGIPCGEAKSSERTYVELLPLAELLRNPYLDWSMLGIIQSVLFSLPYAPALRRAGYKKRSDHCLHMAITHCIAA
jgi:ADP-ribose pyrophosphatase YjhB (NUDIX family)